jgi:hypothetical protein
VVLTVTDAAGNRGTSQTLTVNAPSASACNQALGVVASASPASSLKVRTSTITLSTVVTNSNNAACYASATLSSMWSMLSRPPGSQASLSNLTAASPTFVPDAKGSYVLFVSVTDTLGNRGTATVTTALVDDCAVAPVVTIGQTPATTVELNQPVTASALVADANATNCSVLTAAPFTYAWTLNVPATSGAVLSSARGASTRFVPDKAGSYTYFVTVTDALGSQASSSTQTVTPINCNLTSGSIAVSSNAAVPTFTTQQVSAIVTFPVACTSTPPLDYLWSFDSLPAGSNARFNDTTAVNPSFFADVGSTASVTATWVARLTVTDRLSGATVSNTGSFTTTQCGATLPIARSGVSLPAPVVAPANRLTFPPASSKSVVVGAGVNFQFQAGTDIAADNPNSACGGVLSFKWTLLQLPPGSTAKVSPETAALPVMTMDKVGDYILQLVISDGFFTSKPTYIRVTGTP